MGGGDNASQPRRRQTEKEREEGRERGGERERQRERTPEAEGEGATNCPRNSTHVEMPVRVRVGCDLQAST